MKKLAVVMLALSWLACGEEDDPPPATNTCTPAESNSTKCDGNNLLRCDGTVWVLAENCAATNKECKAVAGLTGVARCESPVTPAAEFEVCSTSVPCEAGLTCSDLLLLSEDQVCLTDCTTPSVCAAGTEYCEPGTLGTASYSDVPFCFPVADRNGLCLLNDDGCSGDLTCQTFDGGANFLCKQMCSGAEVGTTPAACGTETCLAGAYVEIEGGDATPVTCATVGSAAGCSENYVCREVNFSATQTPDIRQVCARPVGVCGLEADVPVGADFASQTTWQTFLGADDATCNLLGTDYYCGDYAGPGAAELTCADTRWAGSYDPGIPCNGFDDFSSCFGFGECGTFDGTTFECIVGLSVCVAFCTDPDGVEDPGLCGTGYTCGLPTYDPGFRPAAQVDGTGNLVECDAASGGPTNCTGDFVCDTETYSDGDFCLKPRKICLPN